MTDFDEVMNIRCNHCKKICPTFNDFKVHIWLNHNTTYGSVVYPELLRKQGFEIVEQDDLDFLLELLDDDYEGEWALSPDDWIRLKELRGKYGK